MLNIFKLLKGEYTNVNKIILINNHRYKEILSLRLLKHITKVYRVSEPFRKLYISVISRC